MVKKYANAMTPHLVYVNHQFMWEPLTTQMDVLVLAKRLLLLGLWFCFGYALLLFIQGYSNQSNGWIIAAGLVAGSTLRMTYARKDVVAHERKNHFFNVALFYCAPVTLLACVVHQNNPWLVSACLAACLFIHVYAGQTIFRPVVKPEQEVCPKKKRQSAVAAACLGLFFVAIAPTSFGWVAIPALSTVLALHGWRLWFRFRDTELSQEQHADIWPPALNNMQTASQAWNSLTKYIAAETLDIRVLRAVVNRVDEPDALLAYFEGSSLRESSPTQMTQLVQERLCALDPHACMVFNMETDPYQAARTIARMRSGLHDAPELLELPELDGNEYAE